MCAKWATQLARNPIKSGQQWPTVNADARARDNNNRGKRGGFGGRPTLPPTAHRRHLSTQMKHHCVRKRRDLHKSMSDASFNKLSEYECDRVSEEALYFFTIDKPIMFTYDTFSTFNVISSIFKLARDLRISPPSQSRR